MRLHFWKLQLRQFISLKKGTKKEMLTVKLWEFNEQIFAHCQDLHFWWAVYQLSFHIPLIILQDHEKRLKRGYQIFTQRTFKPEFLSRSASTSCGPQSLVFLRKDFVKELHKAVVDHKGDGNIKTHARHPRQGALVERLRPLVPHYSPRISRRV